MSIRTDLEKRIEKERQKIADMRRDLEKTESFAQGLQEALRLLPKDDQGSRQGVQGRTTATFRRGSDVEKAYNVLRSAGVEMHISEILLKIGKEDTKPNRMNLSSSLSRYVRDAQIFTRPNPNSFGLVEHTTPPLALVGQLPPEFGTEELEDKDD
jgi:hypothetical protein